MKIKSDTVYDQVISDILAKSLFVWK